MKNDQICRDVKLAGLSNFQACDLHFRVKGVCYYAPTLEHAYQACKALELKDFLAILSCATPAAARDMGQRVPVRPIWNRLKVMKALLELKFRDPEQRARLDQTKGEVLVEYTRWHDNFWGDCVCPKCAGIRGQNHLGQLLMLLRDGEAPDPLEIFQKAPNALE